MSIVSRSWWELAGRRALRTVLVALLPLLGPLAVTPLGDLPDATRTALAALALAAIASLATSLASLPERGNGVTARWAAALDRGARSFGQVLAATAVAALTLGDLTAAVLAQALVAGVTSVLLGVIGTLPEAGEPAVDTHTWPLRHEGDMTPEQVESLRSLYAALDEGDHAREAIGAFLRRTP